MVACYAKPCEHTKIIAMTGEKYARTEGFDVVFAKPFSIEALICVIDEYLGSKGEEYHRCKGIILYDVLALQDC